MSLRSWPRRPLVHVYNRWLEFKVSRERSVKVVARRNDKQAFETIFGSADLLSEYLSPARLAFYGEIAAICASFDPASVIDVGCGSGHFLAAVAERVPTVERLVGVDYAEAAVAQLSVNAPAARGIVTSIYDLDLGDELFDVVVSTEVLEHLADPSRALKVLRNLCSPGGRLLLTVPDGERDDYEGHINFWSDRQFHEFLTAAGQPEVRRGREGDLVAVVAVPS